ncbi:MAG TPA: response regulator transcription factor [Kiloniellaceae bacterium]|nr:response regulator transcription factor [Kiloniellaceae bacterium]
MPRILVVEDDDMIRERLLKALKYEGYEVAGAENGAVALRLMEQFQPDLVIADVLMPDVGGFDFVSVLRSKADTRVVPIIIVTALSERLSQREFMELGVDDYLTKPFHIEELLRAVRTQLRKAQWRSEDRQDIRDAQLISFASWRYDVERRGLMASDGEERSLTISEAQLLMIFLNNANRVLDRDTLMELLGRSKSSAQSDRGIDVLIGRLRRKIEVDAKRPKIIETIRSGGYILNAEVRGLQALEG